MATGETGFDDVTFDTTTANTSATPTFRQVMSEDSERAATCHRFLAQLAGASPNS